MSNQENLGVFIGRTKELQLIDAMVNDPSRTCYYYRIRGQGGVGKTWLLREVYHRYHRDSRIALAQLDYGETRYQGFLMMYISVMKQFENYLTEEDRGELYVRLSEYDRISRFSSDLSFIEKREQELYGFGVILINRISAKRRVLFLNDTL